MALVVQWAQEHGEVGGVLTSHLQLSGRLREAGHEVVYVDTGSARRALPQLARVATRRSALHLFHITRLWRAVLMAPLFALVRGRTVLVLHSGSTATQVRTMRPVMRLLLQRALYAYDEIWTVNDEIKALLPERLRQRAVVVVPFDGAPAGDSNDVRDPHALALATNAGLPHYNAELGIEAARAVRGKWPDTTLHILAYGNDGPRMQQLREQVGEEGWVTLTFDLPGPATSEVLRRTGCFLRPTSWDGDSVIVREALASGARVVASDCAPRPRGVELAPLDAAGIARAVLEGGRVSDGLGLADRTMAEAAQAAIGCLGSRA